jgi:opine dehydrogenase
MKEQIMNRKPVAVLGGGGGGHMMAVDLTARGYEVNLYEHPDFADHFQTTLKRGSIEAVGIGPNGTFPIHQVSLDIEKTVKEVEWIHVSMAATGHDTFFDELVAHIQPGHKVVVWAGDFGALLLRKKLLDAGKDNGVTIIEASTLPYGTRLVEPGKINLLLVAECILVASIPNGDLDSVFDDLAKMFPSIAKDKNVLCAAFNNPNPIVHPPGALLNTGRIEYSKGDFCMYGEGVTQSVAYVIREIYMESRAVGRALSFDMKEYAEKDFHKKTSIMGNEFICPFDPFTVIEEIVGPRSVQDRYIVEDLPMGLVPRSELGKLVGVPTPVINGIVSIGSIVCQIDFWKSGRTLKKLGLAGMSTDEILSIVD